MGGIFKTEVKDGNRERTLTRKFGGKANHVLVFMARSYACYVETRKRIDIIK